MNNKSISFSVTEDQYEIISHEARSRGLTPSVFAKMTLFDRFNKSPSRGIMAKLDEIVTRYKHYIESQPQAGE